MKKRCYTQSDGTVAIVTFAPGVDPEQGWAEMRALDQSLPAEFVDVEDKDLPSRKDADGVSCRNQWKIDGGKIKRDPTLPNPHREVYEAEKRIESLIKKSSPTNGDIVALEQEKRAIESIKKRTFG